MKQMTEDQFDAQFTVVDGPEGEGLREINTHIPDRDSKHLWTVVDVDGDLYIVNGWSRVDRFGYVYTEEPWTEDIEAVWYISPDDDEDETLDDGEDTATDNEGLDA